MDIATLWSITRWENLSIFVFDDSQTPERGLWIFNLAPLMVQLILCRILILHLLKTMMKQFFLWKMFLIVFVLWSSKGLSHIIKGLSQERHYYIITAFLDFENFWSDESYD